MHYFTGLFIVLCFGVFVAYIAIESFTLRNNGKRQFEWRFWGFAVIYIVFLAFQTFFAGHMGRVFWMYGPVTDILADIGALLGVVVAVSARRALGQSWSSEIVIQERHELVERGPYAHVRHPMYSGISLMLVGVLLWYGRMSWLIVFVFVFFGLYFKSKSEEKLLEGSFPQYSEYRKRTKAIVPLVL